MLAEGILEMTGDIFSTSQTPPTSAVKTSPEGRVEEKDSWVTESEPLSTHHSESKGGGPYRGPGARPPGPARGRITAIAATTALMSAWEKATGKARRREGSGAAVQGQLLIQ